VVHDDPEVADLLWRSGDRLMADRFGVGDPVPFASTKPTIGVLFFADSILWQNKPVTQGRAAGTAYRPLLAFAEPMLFWASGRLLWPGGN